MKRIWYFPVLVVLVSAALVFIGSVAMAEETSKPPGDVSDPAAMADMVGSELPSGELVLEGEVTIFSYPLSVLWDNGPLVTHPGGGYNGEDASALQSAIGMNTYGFGNQSSLGYRMADDFEIANPGGWRIEAVTFFAYQTATYDYPPSSPITGVYFQIWNGPPDDPSSSVVWGDLTTNRLNETAWSGIYRVIDTDITSTQRPIMANTAYVNLWLPPGIYWLDWMTGGSGASGPWAPPITILGETTTGNAMQYTTDWAPVLDIGSGTQQGMPFIISGPTGNEWVTIGLGSGCPDWTRHDAEYFPGTSLAYILGGRSSVDTLGDIYAFDPTTGSCQDTAVDMPTPVSNYTIATLEFSDGYRLCTFGGRDPIGGQTRAVQCYSPTLNDVIYKADLPEAFTGYIPGGVEVVNNRAYIFGGYGPSASPYMTDVTYEYNPTTNTYTAMGNLSLARSYMFTTVVDGKIYAFGGNSYDGFGLIAETKAELFDPSTATWSDAAVPDLPVASGEGRAFGFNSDTGHSLSGKIVLAGGGQWPGETAEALLYDPYSQTYDYTFADLNVTRRNHAAFFQSDGALLMWVLGGRSGSDNPPYAPIEFYHIKASMYLTKTVGTVPGVCADTDEITVIAGTEVYYCYQVKNTGYVSLNHHELEDSQLGMILHDLSLMLVPGAFSPEVIIPATPMATVTNDAIWTSFNTGLCPTGLEIGVLLPDDPIFNRPAGSGVSCSPSSIGTAVHYDVYSYSMDGLPPHDLFASLVGGATFDTVLVFYQASDGSQNPFDPDQPCLNNVAYNDDYAGTFQSQINGIDLAPGWIDVVVTTYANGITGPYNMGVWSTSCHEKVDVVTINSATVHVLIFDLELTPEVTTFSGEPGETVLYSLTLTNLGNVNDTFTINFTDNSWGVQVSEDSITLTPGESSSVIVQVSIPADAKDGNSDTVTVTATSTGDSDVSASSTLTTVAEAKEYLIYLPMTLKN